ncbi:MAG: chloride channel protein, partial [Elusimicrobia bacterium]|nr:chloride channel protein [Elusimicrobiota bacterium]
AAAAFSYGTAGLRRAFRLLPADLRPIAGGLALGALAFWSPYALSFGEAQLGTLPVLPAAAAFFLAAAAAKALGASVTLSSGWRGGFIIPLFFIGAALGRFGHALWPQTNAVVLMAALMAATNTGVTKTPLGSTLVVTGMAGIRLVPTTLAAAVVAQLLTSQVGLIHTQRTRG